METRTIFPRDTVGWPDVRIAMPDGVELSARIWLPADAEARPVPAILEHLPYRKRDGTIARDELTHPYLAGHGYACIRVDMRGSGDSGGLMHDEYERQEWDDAIAVMQWARAQPWCTGDWGMMGISWGGFNALQVAGLRPKGLKAIITLCSTTDRYADDIHYKGGCLLGENLGWAAQMLAYSARPPDPAVVGEGWREMWRERLEALPFLLETWLAHQTRDAYWKHGSPCEDYDAIEAATLAIGGWHDGYRNTPAALVESLSCPVKAIVGPWIHKYPHFAAPEPRIGFLQEALRWWDRWLKGAATGVEDEPSQRLWLMDSVAPARWLDERPGRWIAVDGPSDMRWRCLTGGGIAGREERCDVLLRSPQTCGDGAGEYFPFAFGPELPADQTEDDAMSACFDERDESMEVVDLVGAPMVRLKLVPHGAHAIVAVRLCDLRPDGTSALISHGFLNLTHRRSHEAPEPLVPGEEIEVEVTLDQCAYRVPAGHRLRVAVSTAYWPFIWPGPDDGGVTLTGGEVGLPVYSGTQRATPVFEPAEGARPWRHTVLRAPRMTRDTETREDGTRIIRIHVDDGELEDAQHGLVTSLTCDQIWTIHPGDPLSAHCEIVYEGATRRGDWSTSYRAVSRLRGDAGTWYPEAELDTFEDGKPFISRRFSTPIRRHFL